MAFRISGRQHEQNSLQSFITGKLRNNMLGEHTLILFNDKVVQISSLKNSFE